jgi:serine/threonine-protein kinase
VFDVLLAVFVVTLIINLIANWMVDAKELLQQSLGPAYTVERELGGGGMARVFVVTEHALGRSVAVKVLPPELSTELSVERFRREVRVAAQLQHPHIIPLLSAGDAAGLLYYTTPFVPGETLRAKLERDSQLSSAEALRLTSEVASALAYAHAQGVIHRDVKPENILLSDGHALLADFGVAKAVSEAKSQTLTATGISLGTPRYMSPEQAAGDQTVDGRSDLYSLACVLYELLAGQPPFTAPSAQGVIAQHFTAPFPKVRHSRPDVTEAIDAAIAKATSKIPADRHATVSEFVKELTLAARPDWSDGRRRFNSFAVAGLAIAVLAVGASFVLSRSRGNRAASIPSPPTSKSVAVLPLSVVGGDSANSYFADGMTEALISALANVRGVRVTPRGSAFALKGTKLTAREIGDTLHVTTILDGSVQRSGERLRIAVSLSDLAHDSTLWSGTYDGNRADVFRMQDSIAKAVVGALQVQLSSAPQLVRRATSSNEAYDLYLRGRALAGTLTEPNLLKSITLYQDALAKDSMFALAYAGLTESYGQLADVYWAPKRAYPKAKEAALRALALDSTLAETRIALGTSKVYWDWDFKGGEREFRRALDLAPDNAEAHGYLALVLTLSNPAAAVAEAQKALDLDPLSAVVAAGMGFVYLYLDDVDRLYALTSRLVRADSADDFSRAMLEYASASRGDRATAVALHDKRSCNTGYVCAFEAAAFARLGDRVTAQQDLARMSELSRHQYVPADAAGWAYVALGDRDRAIAAFTRGVDEHSASAIGLRVLPALAPLRADPRFHALIDRIGR